MGLFKVCLGLAKRVVIGPAAPKAVSPPQTKPSSHPKVELPLTQREAFQKIIDSISAINGAEVKLSSHRTETFNSHWCAVAFGGPVIQNGGKELFKVYAQVDHGQIPAAVKVLIKVAQKRMAKGMPTQFEFLVSRHDLRRERNAILGCYYEADPAATVIVLYFHNQEERNRFMHQLSLNTSWHDIESQRVAKVLRAGTTAYINRKTRIEFRTICYNK
ncbi:MAG: hypothetical protein WCV91_01245 [Candidatus Margulisiibacteriota bacterium]